MSTLLGEAEQRRDQDLVRRHQAGDALAFAQLYKLHHERLLRYCRRQVRDPHLAEELAQEAFLRAYHALDRFEGGRNFYPWLTVIARRLVIDHQRRNGRVQPRAVIDLGAIEPVEAEVVERAEHHDVRLALRRVRSRHREVLQLRDWDGLSYEAIAEQLGTSTTTVQSLLHRARQALRREYLALSGEQRIAGVVLAALAGARRLRDRLVRLSGRWPDGAALGVPLAAATLSVGTLLAPAGITDLPTAGVGDGWSERLSSVAPVRATATSAVADTRRGETPSDPAPVAELSLDRNRVAAARSQSASMPAAVEAGPAFAGADPQAVLDDTINAARTRLEEP